MSQNRNGISTRFSSQIEAKKISIESPPSFAVHYWNHMRAREEKDKRLTVKRGHPLYKIFEANCPLTYEHVLRDMEGDPY